MALEVALISIACDSLLVVAVAVCHILVFVVAVVGRRRHDNPHSEGESPVLSRPEAWQAPDSGGATEQGSRGHQSAEPR